ncbi:MAG: hypothetical protein CSA07_04170 [Bacteroidia bacterium]|nr:MAG: hypothetical protein CSA07_04170 [Bacteroidia bacterium]
MVGSVWGWDIPGVEGSLEHLGDDFYAIRYSIGGRGVLTVGHDALDFQLAGMKHRTQLPEGSVPTVDALRALLEGLPAFYHAGTVEFNQRFEDVRRVARMMRAMEEASLRFKLYPRELYASWTAPWVRG